jgi:hypothetical protein
MGLFCIDTSEIEKGGRVVYWSDIIYRYRDKASAEEDTLLGASVSRLADALLDHSRDYYIIPLSLGRQVMGFASRSEKPDRP